MPRKTLKIEEIIDQANATMEQAESVEDREAIFVFTENLLVQAGSYKGFDQTSDLTGNLKEFRK